MAKKYLQLLAMLIFCFSLAAVIASPHPVSASTVLTNDDFNSGTMPGWTLDQSGGTITVQNIPSSTDKSVRLIDTSATSPVSMTKIFTAQNYMITAEFSLRAEQLNQGIAATLQDSTGASAAQIRLDANGKIRYTDITGTVDLQSYTTDTFYDFKIVADANSDNFDVYINNVLVKTDRQTILNVALIDRIVINTFVSGTGTFYVDNVKVSTDGSSSTELSNDDFNSGTMPGWTLDQTGGTITVQNIPSSTDKSVQLLDTSTTSSVKMTKTFTAQNMITAEFSLRAEQLNQGIAATLQDSTGASAAQIRLDANGKIRYTDITGTMDLQSYTTGTFYDFKIVADVNSDSFDVYINNVLVKNDLQTISNVAVIDRIVINTFVSNTGTFYVDNVKVSTDGSSSTELSNDDFNSGTMSGWTLDQTGGTITVQNIPSSTDKSVQLLDTSTTSSVKMTKTFTAQNMITAEFSLRAEQLNQGIAVTLQDSTGASAAQIRLDANGKIRYTDITGTVDLQSYTAGTFYAFKIVADANSDTFDLYINNVLVKTGLQTISNVSLIDRIVINTFVVNTGTFYVDNVKISFPSSSVTTYSAPTSLVGFENLFPSDYYSVVVNGKKPFVYMTKNDIPSTASEYESDIQSASFANFASSGPINVDIFYNGTINSVTVRPKSDAITPTVSGNKISFSLSSPKKLSVEINGRANPLFLFADASETNVPSPSDPNVIYYAPGVYDIGTDVDIPSNKTVYIAGGAIVKGTFFPGDTHDTAGSTNTVYSGTAASNIAIKGRGILYGGHLDPANKQGMIAASGVNGMTLEGITIIDSPYKMAQFYGAVNVTVTNVKDISWHGETDFINASAFNITVDDCFVRNNDDFVNFSQSRHAIVKNSVVWNGNWGGGPGASRSYFWDTYDVLLQNIDIIRLGKIDGKRGAFWFSGEEDRQLKNIMYDNIRLEDGVEQLIMYNNLDYPSTGWGIPTRSSKVNNIYFKNVAVNDSIANVTGGVIRGYSPTYNMQNITFENLTYTNGSTLITNASQAGIVANSNVSNLSFAAPITAIKLTNSMEDLFYSGSSVTFKTDVSGYSGSITQVEFYKDGVLLGSDTTAPYNYSLTTSVNSSDTYASSYVITAKVIGSAGNVTSAPYYLTVYESSAITMNQRSSDKAYNKTATASSTPDTTKTASSAVDGYNHRDFYWKSDTSNTNWLKVDLGSTQSISRAIINWKDLNSAQSATIEVSTDNVNWTPVYTISSAADNYNDCKFTSVNARYVRVNMTAKNPNSYNNSYMIWELEVY
ncbi:discoidin domain-containing protein [Paenibacillus pectinilyticus]|nr:discoidin domain-containing protein [Paenibacillus pectinilyticus]